MTDPVPPPNPGSARLAGRRVVVTRPADQAEPLAQRLRAIGAEPVVVPLIRIVEPSDGGAGLREALERRASYDWVVVSSPNGAGQVRAALDTTASISTAGRPAPRLAAVGTATEQALGRRADLVPDDQIAGGLVAAFPYGPGRVLVAQAEQAGVELVAGLTAKGWAVDIVSAYRTVPVVPLSEDLADALSADAVLFASASAVRAWLQVFGVATPSVAVAIGPATATEAAKLGLKLDAVASDHSLDGLVGTLVTRFSDPE